MSPSIEAIVAKRPDFVIGVSSATDPAKARELESLGFKVTLISLASLSDILSSIKDIARLLGRADVGEQLVDKINRQIDQTKETGRTGAASLHSLGCRAAAAGGGGRKKLY